MSSADWPGRGSVRPAFLRASVIPSAELEKDRERALALTPVSRETLARLDRFVALLLERQPQINLIAPSTAPTLWTRHIADSLQLLALAPEARVWADFGSGAGFPGLVIACALADDERAKVHLVESSAKKAAFLREAAQASGAPVAVHAARVADFVKTARSGIDAVTARAFAPLSGLLTVSYPLLIRGAVGVFPKGQGVEVELTEAAKCWTLQATLAVSRTDPRGRIVVVRGLEPSAGASTRKGSRNDSTHRKRRVRGRL
jgi:16S rRNA (guanine527-N7)-methyltransferase